MCTSVYFWSFFDHFLTFFKIFDFSKKTRKISKKLTLGKLLPNPKKHENFGVKNRQKFFGVSERWCAWVKSYFFNKILLKKMPQTHTQPPKFLARFFEKKWSLSNGVSERSDAWVFVDFLMNF